ncbi:unnamed protein product, partial [Coregonus sp. 'balchen']
ALNGISPFEGLSSDREALHRRHQLAKRETQPQDQTLQLDPRAFHRYKLKSRRCCFNAFLMKYIIVNGCFHLCALCLTIVHFRTFRLRLRRDTMGFTEPFKVFSENRSSTVDLFHLYSEELEDERCSSCHSTVIQGQFEGSVLTTSGTYQVEAIHRYTSQPSQHHSIIYHEDDMDKRIVEHLMSVLLKSIKWIEQMLFHEELSILPTPFSPLRHVPTVYRSKRTSDNSKSCCLLFPADHFYYRKFKSVEAVVAQKLCPELEVLLDIGYIWTKAH